MAAVFSAFDGHEQVLFGRDEPSGLRCVIAVHSTTLGPALGGTRCHAYATEAEAVDDVLRLSRAMTLKAAAAGIDVGGGKAVLWADPADKTEPMLRAYGRMIDSLGGRYVTACDVGTYPADMGVIGRETRWVTGADPEEGGSGDSGVLTAVGAHAGLRACAAHAWGTPDLAKRHIAIQGVGKVGRRLATQLAEDGARLTVADTDPAAATWCAERLGADVVAADEVMRVECDILSPNALGNVLDDISVKELSCRVVAGAANNQLAEDAIAEALADAGVLYAPDFVINAGGLIQVADELHPAGYHEPRARRRAESIGERLREVLAVADVEGRTPLDAAMRVAERRIAAIGSLQNIRSM